MRGADEGAVAQLAHGLHEFLARVHHDRAVPGDRLADRGTRDEEEAHPLGAGRHRHLVARAELDQRAVAREVADVDLLPVDFLLEQDAAGRGGIGEAGGALEDIGEGRAAGVDPEAAPAHGRHGDVEILRLGGDAVDRALAAPEGPHDHLHPGAVIVDHLGDVGAAHVLIARPGHLEVGRQVRPELEAVHLAARVARGHLLVQDARAGRHPLHIPRPERAAVAEAVAMLDAAREDVGDRLDPAVGVPGEARAVVGRAVAAEIVEEQEGVHPLGVAEAEGAVEAHARPLHRRRGMGFAGDGADRHGRSPRTASGRKIGARAAPAKPGRRR